MKNADSANTQAVSRRTILATLPALPAMTLDTPAIAASAVEVPAQRLACLAINLRRADDMATAIGAPIETDEAWRWIIQQVRICPDLDSLNPIDRADMVASIEGLKWEEQRALMGQFAQMAGAI